MSRYIDADKIPYVISENGCLDDFAYRYDINEVPTADVVEVVRCKDCAHYHEMKGFDYKGRKAHHCVWHSALRGENDYCSDGIRRAENGKS